MRDKVAVVLSSEGDPEVTPKMLVVTGPTGNETLYHIRLEIKKLVEYIASSADAPLSWNDLLEELYELLSEEDGFLRVYRTESLSLSVLQAPRKVSWIVPFNEGKTRERSE